MGASGPRQTFPRSNAPRFSAKCLRRKEKPHIMPGSLHPVRPGSQAGRAIPACTGSGSMPASRGG